MHTPDWVQDAIFYQIFPDRFARSARLPDLGFEAWEAPPTHHGFKGGDLYGVLERIDYLQKIGITALYLNPVFASASNHRYHTYDYYHVDPLLGGDQALRLLLDEAHRRGMRVILDGVFNHASRGFWQFHHVLENGAGSPYKEWFHFDPQRLSGERPWGAYPSKQEQEAIEQEGSLKAIGYQGWWNLPGLPKFNTETPAVRAFLFDVAEHWMRFGIDGWRLDVPAEIDDDPFWREFRKRVRAINPEAYIVGEIWHEAQRWLSGDQFDGVMNYLVTAAALSFFGNEQIDMGVVNQAGGLQGRVHPGMDAHGFADEIDRLTNLYDPAITRSQLNLLDSHDMPRFLTCVKGDVSALQLALLFLFTYPGAPCLFYGDEIGLDGGHDPDCRKAFPWNDSLWNHDLQGYTKNIIALRKEHQTLRRGSFQREFADGRVYAFSRQFQGEHLLVLFNADGTTRQAALAAETTSGQPALIFGPDPQPQREGNTLQFTLPARSGCVLRL